MNIFSIKTKNGATLTAYIAEPIEGNIFTSKKPAILILPGGAYSHVSKREGEPVALRFTTLGFQTFVLEYSTAPKVKFPTELVQTVDALKLIRENAKNYHVDPSKVAVLGFSAGGHLAASVSNYIDEKTDEEVKKLSGLSFKEYRPDAAVLCYPVITSGEFSHRGSFENLGKDLSLENCVSEMTPPTFLWHTYEDQTVPVENSLLYMLALKKHNIPAELHIFPHGCHGSSLCNELTTEDNKNYVISESQNWPELAARFLKDIFK